MPFYDLFLWRLCSRGGLIGRKLADDVLHPVNAFFSVGEEFDGTKCAVNVNTFVLRFVDDSQSFVVAEEVNFVLADDSPAS